LDQSLSFVVQDRVRLLDRKFYDILYRADRIIVLVDGKVVQTGNFSELNNTPGMFASFAQRQLL
jgi:ABC-type transport system involved in Fe-S cluster assembly fused permease/ATPase subunit